MITVATNINATKEKVWDILLDKIFHPDKYIPGIEEFELKEREPNEYVRTIYTETDDVVDLVVIKPEALEIETSMVRHLFLKGKLFQRIQENEEGTQLIVESHQEITLEELKGLDMEPALEAALEQIKDLAENSEETPK